MAKLISIIIPVYNEENTIKIILNKVLKQNNFDKEIIVINDSSTDNTKSLIEEFFLSKIKLINNEKNYGKGFSVKRGIEVASGDIILIQDGDLEYDPSDYEKILKPIIENRADVVFGSRFLGSGEKRVLFFWHRIGNYLLTLFSNALTNLNLTDMEVGYKAFKKEVLANIVLEENRFGFEPEITAKIAKKKLKIFEVGIKYYGRTYEEGKKISWKDGFAAIYCILKYNLFK
ncbi:glycosyltransferase family 2 protein [Candidatus Pelagibacter sp. HIMB1506]|uniref:glycosyltransferase family 2 protein n=1 Tax=Candidatus Pelagibacter sp. HIMB1506 TaxID=3413337 RepID=UPI003F82C6D2